MLEGKPTPPDKGDEIIAPKVSDVGRLFDHLTVSIHSIDWNIGTNVQVFTQHWKIRIAGFTDGEQRARFGITSTIGREVERVLLRQNAQVCLYVTCAKSGCVSRVLTRAKHETRLAWAKRQRRG